MKKVFSLILALMLVLSFALPATAAGKVKTTVTLSHTGTVTIAVGQTIQITATVTPDAPVAWSTKKAAVATVDGSGNVTGAAEGTTTIIAKAVGKSAKVKVKVVDPYKPDGISFAQGKAITVNVGQPVQLNAVLSPTTAQATLTWKSGKVKVATVDAAGVLNPIAEGKTKVTVTTHNKKKATIAVTVVDPYKPTKVVIPQGKSAALIAGQTLQLGASLEPATAQASLTWTSSKPGVAVVDGNGLVTAVGKGSAKITVQAANYKKVKATFTVKVSANATTSIKELSGFIGMPIAQAQQQLKLSHNPKKDPEYYNGNGFYLYVPGDPEDDYYGAVAAVDVYKDNGYAVMGLTVGMAIEQADAALKQAGWTCYDSYDEENGYWMNSYEKGNHELSVMYRSSTKKIVDLHLFN